MVSVILAAMLPFGMGRATERRSPVETGLLQASVRPVEVIARFERRIPAGIEKLRGLRVHYRFTAVPAIFATASPEAVRALAVRSDMAYLERNKEILPTLDTATIASRAREVFDPEHGGVVDGNGDLVDGRGVGVAIVDTGLDAEHPDHMAPGKVRKNLLATPAGFIERSNTAMHGHGTHVAGIAAGNGLTSNGLYRGVAPKASLYAFSVFTPTSTSVFPSMAFDWILQNGNAQDPPIRVVNNSWRCTSAACDTFNPEQLHVRLASMLAEAGVTVTWAAGNDGGDGFVSSTAAETHNPTPGIIGVANYRDDNAGVRTGCLATTSSRGAAADPTTWPDVAAPGYGIMSTWALHAGASDTTSQRLPNGTNNYRVLNGTSMAAPHVAGVVALMLQANPTLTPADIEYILKSTSSKLSCGVDYVRADPSHSHDGANYAEGHGLIDAYEAVRAAQAFTGIPESPPAEELPPEFQMVRTAVEVQRRLYLSGDSSLSPDAPRFDAPRARLLRTPELAVHTSEPFDEDLQFTGAEVDAWIGTTGECPCAYFTAPRIRAQLEILRSDGSVVPLGEQQHTYWRVTPAAPVHRDFTFRLTEPVTVYAGDRVSVSLRVDSPGALGAPPVEATWTLYSESTLTPSRVSLGHLVRPHPGSDEYCKVRQDCALIGGPHQAEGMTCGTSDVVVSWYGPPGSTAFFSCEGGTASCTVAGEPGEPWGRCESGQQIATIDGTRGGVCAYRTREGGPAQGSYGRCVSTEIVEQEA